mmetsp:Transcript_106950/g.340682  ORF Transcript_106950/g.340682 Transcript_106950/m.340682 type:complete len:252 (-) Transcript_106950:7-762(-)
MGLHLAVPLPRALTGLIQLLRSQLTDPSQCPLLLVPSLETLLVSLLGNPQTALPRLTPTSLTRRGWPGPWGRRWHDRPVESRARRRVTAAAGARLREQHNAPALLSLQSQLALWRVGLVGLQRQLTLRWRVGFVRLLGGHGVAEGGCLSQRCREFRAEFRLPRDLRQQLLCVALLHNASGLGSTPALAAVDCRLEILHSRALSVECNLHRGVLAPGLQGVGALRRRHQQLLCLRDIALRQLLQRGCCDGRA